jgi:hypothetical protein
MNTVWILLTSFVATILFWVVYTKCADYQERKAEARSMEVYIKTKKNRWDVNCQPGQYILLFEDQDRGTAFEGWDPYIVDTYPEALRKARENPDDERLVLVLDWRQDLLCYGLNGRLYFRECVEPGKEPSITKEEAIQRARRECEQRGWPWRGTIMAHRERGMWIIRAIEEMGGIAQICIDQDTGEVKEAGFAPPVDSSEDIG